MISRQGRNAGIHCVLRLALRCGRTLITLYITAPLLTRIYIAVLRLRRRYKSHVVQHSNDPYAMVQAPLYPDKATIFHNSSFVLGYDTAVRLVMPKYYGGHDGMLLQLASMSFAGCSVIVAGRAVTDDTGSSTFKTFEDVEVPEVITKLVRLEFPDSFIYVVMLHALLVQLHSRHLHMLCAVFRLSILCMGADVGTVFINTRRAIPE